MIFALWVDDSRFMRQLVYPFAGRTRLKSLSPPPISGAVGRILLMSVLLYYLLFLLGMWTETIQWLSFEGVALGYQWAQTLSQCVSLLMARQVQA